MGKLFCANVTEEEKKRNFAYMAGAIFAIGWWVWIDATAFVGGEYKEADKEPPITAPMWLPAIFASIIMIMLNIVDSSKVAENDEGSGRAKAWFMIWFVFLGACLIAGWWIAWEIFLFPKEAIPTSYPGLALIIQNTLIFISALMYRFGVKIEGGDGGWF